MTTYFWAITDIQTWLTLHDIDPETVGIVHLVRPSGASAWWLICDRMRHPKVKVVKKPPFDLLKQEFESSDSGTTAAALTARQRLFRSEDVDLISVAETFGELVPGATRAEIESGVWEGDDADW